jgi:ankyrin repeat protein
MKKKKIRGWRTLWFQLKGARLTWAKVNDANTDIGSLDIEAITHVELKFEKKRASSKPLTRWKFDLITPHKAYHLAASSEPDVLYWIERIQKYMVPRGPGSIHGPGSIDSVDPMTSFQLHNETKRGNLAEVQRLLSQGYPINQENKDRQTPLHIAAQEGNLAMVQLLVEKYDAFLAARDKNDYTCLHSACLNGHLDVVRYLLLKGARNSVNTSGATPLHYLVRSNSKPDPRCEEILQIIISQGSDINQQKKTGETPLHCAVQNNSVTWVSLLLKYLADPNARER